MVYGLLCTVYSQLFIVYCLWSTVYSLLIAVYWLAKYWSLFDGVSIPGDLTCLVKAYEQTNEWTNDQNPKYRASPDLFNQWFDLGRSGVRQYVLDMPKTWSRYVPRISPRVATSWLTNNPDFFDHCRIGRSFEIWSLAKSPNKKNLR